MFGRHALRRQESRNDKLRYAMSQQAADYKKSQELDPMAEYKNQQNYANQVSDDMKGRDLAARSEGKAYADEVLGREYKGLGDNQRRVLQESGDAQINRDIQGYEKKMLAQQGRRGIKGGAAFAQQQDLARLGTEAQQQMQRDLSSLDADMQLKKMAAAYNIEQGEVGQQGLRNQMSRDTMDAYDQKKYQKYLADQANKLFQRI